MANKPITDRELKAVLSTPGSHNTGALPSGGALHLLVKESGTPGVYSRSWVIRFQVNGRSYRKGLGTYKATPSLTDARKKAADYLAGWKEGVDIRKAPTEQAKPKARTLVKLFPEWIAMKAKLREGRIGGELTQRIEYRVRRHILPVLGDKTLDEITPADVANMLNAIPGTQGTRNKIKAYLAQIFQWARACGYFDQYRIEPTETKLLQPFLAEPQEKAEHRAFLSPSDLPRFIAALSTRDSLSCISSLALLFVILNCGRASMVRGQPLAGVPPLTWKQIERRGKVTVLHIAADQMKVKAAGDFEIILSRQSCAVLEYVKALRLSDSSNPDAVVFPNCHGAPICENSMTHQIRHLDARDRNAGGPGFRDPTHRDKNGAPRIATQHGISRATFRTWVADTAPEKAQIAEACLAHKGTGDSYGGAYNRSALNQHRARLLQEWADFCFSDCLEHFLNK